MRKNLVATVETSVDTGLCPDPTLWENTKALPVSVCGLRGTFLYDNREDKTGGEPNKWLNMLPF